MQVPTQCQVSFNQFTFMLKLSVPDPIQIISKKDGVITRNGMLYEKNTGNTLYLTKEVTIPDTLSAAKQDCEWSDAD